MTGAFAAVHDDGRPPGAADLDRLVRAVGGVDTASWHGGPLAAAWAGPGVDAHIEPDRLVLLEGAVYDAPGLGPARDPARSSAPAALVAGWLDAGGPDALAGLRGDFALLDLRAGPGRSLAARDHLGGRSIVWYRTGSRLFLASDVRQLLGLIPARPSPDDAAMAHWLGLSGLPDDRTLYDGVRRLSAAHWLPIGPAAGVPVRYWSPRYADPTPGDVADHAAAVRALLERAVDRRSRPAGAVAVLLSGGLDSSAVAGVARTLDPSRQPRRAYSATFPGHSSVDEGALIGALCERLELRGTRVVVASGSVLAGALEYLAHWEVPPHSPNLFFWLPLFRRAAADGVAALLDGEGGDEIFGLSPYLVADRLRRLRVRDAVDLVRRLPGGRPDLPWRSIRPFLWAFGIKAAVPTPLHELVRRRRGQARYLPRWMLPETVAAYAATDRAARWKAADGPRWWAYLVDAVTMGMGPSLTFDHLRRRTAMAGIEARHPLVDVDLVEYMLRVPPELAFDPRFSRPVLRAAVDGLIPDQVRIRPTKSTFDAVFHESLTGPDLTVIRSLLGPEAEVRRWADLDAVRDQLLGPPPPPGERLRWAQELWRLVTAELWLRAQHAGGLRAGLEGHRFAAAALELVEPSA